MSRYVDIEGDWVDDAVKAYSLGYYEYDEYAIPFEALGSAPSIDLVRCEDCKHWFSDGGAIMFCEHTDVPTDANDYCSYGEREGE